VTRPIPVPDELSAPIWAAAAEHRLVLARCSRCNRLTHPPDVICPNCNDTDPDFTYEEVSPRATVCSWTVLHQSFVPGFDDLLPLTLVDARLDTPEDVRLIGRLVDQVSVLRTDSAAEGGFLSQEGLQLGDRVTIVFEDIAPGVAVPAFALER
jgi:uncharacterized OB-fold protein